MSYKYFTLITLSIIFSNSLYSNEINPIEFKTKTILYQVDENLISNGIYIWNIHDGSILKECDFVSESDQFAIDYNKNSNIFVAILDNIVYKYKADTFEILAEYEVKLDGSRPILSPDSSRLILFNNYTPYIYDFSSNKIIFEGKKNYASVEFIDNNNIRLNDLNSITIVNLNTGNKEILDLRIRVYPTKISWDENVIISQKDDTIELINPENYELINSLPYYPINETTQISTWLSDKHLYISTRNPFDRKNIIDIFTKTGQYLGSILDGLHSTYNNISDITIIDEFIVGITHEGKFFLQDFVNLDTRNRIDKLGDKTSFIQNNQAYIFESSSLYKLFNTDNGSYVKDVIAQNVTDLIVNDKMIITTNTERQFFVFENNDLTEINNNIIVSNNRYKDWYLTNNSLYFIYSDKATVFFDLENFNRFKDIPFEGIRFNHTVANDKYLLLFYRNTLHKINVSSSSIKSFTMDYSSILDAQCTNEYLIVLSNDNVFHLYNNDSLDKIKEISTSLNRVTNFILHDNSLLVTDGHNTEIIDLFDSSSRSISLTLADYQYGITEEIYFKDENSLYSIDLKTKNQLNYLKSINLPDTSLNSSYNFSNNNILYLYNPALTSYYFNNLSNVAYIIPIEEILNLQTNIKDFLIY